MAFTSRGHRFLHHRLPDDHEHLMKSHIRMRRFEGVVDTRSWSVDPFHRHQHLLDLMTEREHLQRINDDEEHKEEAQDKSDDSDIVQEELQDIQELNEKAEDGPYELEESNGQDLQSGNNGQGDWCPCCGGLKDPVEISVEITTSGCQLEPVEEMNNEYDSINDELRNQMLRLSSENDDLKLQLRKARRRERYCIEKMEEMQKQLDQLAPLLEKNTTKSSKSQRKDSSQQPEPKEREREENPHHRGRRKN